MACAVSAMIGIWRVAGSCLQMARRLPAVDLRQAHVHQDQIGRSARAVATPCWPSTAMMTSVAAAFETPREHVAVHLVVFDQENRRHGMDPTR